MTDLIPVRREDVAVIKKAHVEWLINEFSKRHFKGRETAIEHALGILTAALSAPPSAGPDLWQHRFRHYRTDGTPSPWTKWVDGKYTNDDGEEEFEERALYLHPLPSGEAVGLEWRENSLYFRGVLVGVVFGQSDDPQSWVYRLGRGYDRSEALCTEAEARTALESAARAWLSPTLAENAQVQPSLSETTKDQAQPDLALQERGQACKGCEGRGEVGGFDRGDNAWRTERCDYCHGTGIDTGPHLIEPDTNGSFVGDIWFGHPENRTMGKHRWSGSSWEVLPTEMESVLQLLASARTENEKLRQLLVASPSGEFPRLEFLEAMRDCPTAEWGQVAITYSLREAFNYAFSASPLASPQVQQSEGAWQPIETAPKDGTKMLVTDLDAPDRTWVAWWMYGQFNMSRTNGSILSLTHWMPLPSPPTKEDQ